MSKLQIHTEKLPNVDVHKYSAKTLKEEFFAVDIEFNDVTIELFVPTKKWIESFCSVIRDALENCLPS